MMTWAEAAARKKGISRDQAARWALGPHHKAIRAADAGISLGHPIGATGSVRLVTLIHEMVRRDVRYGLVTICGGGGLWICVIVERR